MSELKVKPGDELIFESAQGKEQKLVIAGTVEGNKSYITVPLSFIFALDGVDKDGKKNEDLVFCEASFTVKRAYNRGIQTPLMKFKTITQVLFPISNTSISNGRILAREETPAWISLILVRPYTMKKSV